MGAERSWLGCWGGGFCSGADVCALVMRKIWGAGGILQSLWPPRTPFYARYGLFLAGAVGRRVWSEGPLAINCMSAAGSGGVRARSSSNP